MSNQLSILEAIGAFPNTDGTKITVKARRIIERREEMPSNLIARTSAICHVSLFKRRVLPDPLLGDELARYSGCDG